MIVFRVFLPSPSPIFPQTSPRRSYKSVFRIYWMSCKWSRSLSVCTSAFQNNFLEVKLKKTATFLLTARLERTVKENTDLLQWPFHADTRLRTATSMSWFDSKSATGKKAALLWAVCVLEHKLCGSLVVRMILRPVVCVSPPPCCCIVSKLVDATASSTCATVKSSVCTRITVKMLSRCLEQRGRASSLDKQSVVAFKWRVMATCPKSRKAFFSWIGLTSCWADCGRGRGLLCDSSHRHSFVSTRFPNRNLACWKFQKRWVSCAVNVPGCNKRPFGLCSPSNTSR